MVKHSDAAVIKAIQMAYMMLLTQLKESVTVFSISVLRV
jgi:hypothetical protein